MPSLAKKKGASKGLTPEEILKKVQMDHRTLVRSVFRGVGFRRITGISDKEFTYDNQKTDIDDVFVLENVVLFVEYTATKSESIGGHLKNKKMFYDKFTASTSFVEFLKSTFPDSADQFPANYHNSKLITKVVYCSRYPFDQHYKDNVPDPAYFDYPAVRYFASVAEAIKRSARFELLNFLGITLSKVGVGGQTGIANISKDYHGSLLPEAHSNFDTGFKVVSFYADPDALLRTAYVLRKDGWRDSLNLYQRMISKAKVEAIRAYLKKERRVFINNIIVTLPADVKPLNDAGETINTAKLTDTAPVTIKLPDRPNSVGLIDGQHRVFAYYEGINDDADIAQLRLQQNLLVTGIIYPSGIAPGEREKFEAKLFLEINSTQTSAKSPLKQAIGIVLEPFAPESIAARTLSGLAKQGPLQGFIQQYFYDTEKLKTASIVSYGLRPLVKTSGTDSLFAIWPHPEKNKVAEGADSALLEAYIGFAVDTINVFLRSIRRNLASSRWTTDSRVPGRVLATTYVNSFLIALRLLIGRSHLLDEDTVRAAFDGLDAFDFSAYHSSQYARMAETMVDQFFPGSKGSQV